MMFGYLTLFTALILSVSAAVYSILGLTAIFASAFWPIVVLGGSLEFGKIVTTLWLHKYWNRAELQYKVYLCSAVIILMVLTSMGVFGFLSKAHLDQAIPSGDIQAQVQIFDDKIQTQKDNIKTARAALTQMDSAVDQVMGRSQDEKGADKAVAIRRSQARERTALQNDIAKAQTEITRLQEQRAPIASQARQVEAEVGPIKYIAALIYGDNPEANLLEKAVRWVIILIVIVFDPLALTLLLAATKTFEWERGVNIMAPARRPKYDQDDGPLTDEQLDQIRKAAKNDLPVGNVLKKESLFQDIDSNNYDPPEEEPVKKSSVLAGLDTMWNRAKKLVVRDTEAEHAPVELQTIDTPLDKEASTDDHEDGATDAEKEAQRAWKLANPKDTIKKQRLLYDAGYITDLPWNHPDYRAEYQQESGPPGGDGNLWIPQNGKWINAGPMDQVDLSDLSLVADNAPQSGEVKGFGTQFPTNPIKGDMFLRVDRLPSALYKFNGNIWIEVDKALSDQHAYDAAYIDHLISKISTGEYDPELLSDAERTSIEQRLSGV
jgi:hypothetical protein